MRLKILKRPPRSIGGLSPDYFRVGGIYDMDQPLAELLLTDGLAEATSDEVILVVDDDGGIRELAKRLLAEYGFEVIGAAHGQEALERLGQRCPDLILLDLHMPVMDGWQFRRYQKDLPDRICAAARVLLLSGDDDAVNQATLLGAVGVVKKPFDARDLLDAVWAAIGPPSPMVQPA